jgi:hypothetical protein
MTANLGLALLQLPVPEPDAAIEVLRLGGAGAMAHYLDKHATYWPDHVLDLEDQVRLHEFALIDYRGNVTVQCPKCGTLFAVERGSRAGEFICVCPDCLGEASAATDGVMPPCGYGRTRLEAAQDWSDNA